MSTHSHLVCPNTHRSQEQILLAITIQQRCHDVPITFDVTGNISTINNMTVFTSTPHALGDNHVDYSYARDRLQTLLGGENIQWPASSSRIRP